MFGRVVLGRGGVGVGQGKVGKGRRVWVGYG